jgi:hypothetical protein
MMPSFPLFATHIFQLFLQPRVLLLSLCHLLARAVVGEVDHCEHSRQLNRPVQVAPGIRTGSRAKCAGACGN